MAMGTRKQRQESLFIMADRLPQSDGHPFYKKLNGLLAKADFDHWIEQRWTKQKGTKQKGRSWNGFNLSRSRLLLELCVVVDAGFLEVGVLLGAAFDEPWFAAA